MAMDDNTKYYMKLEIGEKYEIKWQDTFSLNGWYCIEEIKSKAKKGEEFITAVGTYVGTYHNFVVLCGQYATEIITKSTLGCPNFIPKGTIKKIKKLK